MPAQIWVREACPAESALPALVKRPRGSKIRIGYFSADFYGHATVLLAGGLFESHDRERFELVAFNFGLVARDNITETTDPGHSISSLTSTRRRMRRSPGWRGTGH